MAVTEAPDATSTAVSVPVSPSAATLTVPPTAGSAATNTRTVEDGLFATPNSETATQPSFEDLATNLTYRTSCSSNMKVFLARLASNT